MSGTEKPDDAVSEVTATLSGLVPVGTGKPPDRVTSVTFEHLTEEKLTLLLR